MPNIILKLDPTRLANPNLDIRYVLPDLLSEKSGGLIEDGGSDYEEGSNRLLIYLETKELERAVAFLTDFIANTKIIGNDLRDGLEVEVET